MSALGFGGLGNTSFGALGSIASMGVGGGGPAGIMAGGLGGRLGYGLGGNTGGIVGNVLGKALAAKGGAPSLGGVSGILGGFNPGALTTFNPSQARLSVANLAPGGMMPGPMQNVLPGGMTQPIQPETRINFVSEDSLRDDWRLKVSVSQSSGLFYKNPNGSGFMTPLVETDGVVFPYTPSVTTQSSAGYSSQKTTHSNYPSHFYEASEVSAISINGDFTVQNDHEANYLLAVIYFFRAATKMFYGSGANAGNPPPVLFLTGYGSAYLPNVPCLLTSFSHTMPPDVDYYAFGLPDADPQWIERLPTSSQIQISLQPVYSRRQVSNFNLEAFADGQLLDMGFI